MVADGFERQNTRFSMVTVWGKMVEMVKFVEFVQRYYLSQGVYFTHTTLNINHFSPYTSRLQALFCNDKSNFGG